MWVIKRRLEDRFADCLYLESMITYHNGNNALFFGEADKAFRFPDENTAFAVLVFLNRDNLEVTCIE